jgi:uncharacterized protein YecT (DUF1311 family)
MKSILLAMVIVTALTMLAPSGVHAQSPAWRDCIDKTTTNFQWDACGGAEIRRQEARLTVAWKNAIACFDTSTPGGLETQHAFMKEQQAWILFKDSSCKFYYPSKNGQGPYFGREGEVLSAPICRATIIEDRARWLENIAKDCRPH